MLKSGIRETALPFTQNNKRISMQEEDPVMCSACGQSKEQFIPLQCDHTLCLECAGKQEIRKGCLMCPFCSEPTHLEAETLRRLHHSPSSSPALNNSQSSRFQDLQHAFLSSLQHLRKQFAHLHGQLSLKQQALTDQIRAQYCAELDKTQIIRESLKSRSVETEEASESFKRLLRNLKGMYYSVSTTVVEQGVAQLGFKVSEEPTLHRYSRCTHHPTKQVKSKDFKGDKSYANIMKKLDKSRNVLESHLQSMRRTIEGSQDQERSPSLLKEKPKHK